MPRQTESSWEPIWCKSGRQGSTWREWSRSYRNSCGPKAPARTAQTHHPHPPKTPTNPLSLDSTQSTSTPPWLTAPTAQSCQLACGWAPPTCLLASANPEVSWTSFDGLQTHFRKSFTSRALKCTSPPTRCKKRKKKTKVQSKRKKPIAQKLTVPETEYILKWRLFYYKLIGDNDKKKLHSNF